MKKQMLLLAVLLLSVAVAYGGFEKVINTFDSVPADTNYWHFFCNNAADTAHGYVRYSFVSSPVAVGAGAMKLDYSCHNKESWGGFAKLEHWMADSNATYDFSGFDSISVMYYVQTPCSDVGKVHMRLNLHDVSNSVNGNKTYDVGQVEYYYSMHYILDNTPGWHEIKMPIVSNGSTDGQGFWLTGWSGIPGNSILDLDKIKGFSIEFSIGGAGEGNYASGTVILDHLTLKGASSIQMVFFNGKALPGNVTGYGGWGGGSYELTNEQDFTSGNKTGSIKWNTPPNTWAVWDGIVFTMADPVNMYINWPTDSLHFAIKADAGLDSLKIVLSDDDEDGDGADLEYESFYMLKENTVGYDGGWKVVNIALSDFDRNGGAWNGSGMQYDKMMDSTRVLKLKILIGSTLGVGKVVYLDDIWTGNPTFDWVASDPPKNLGVIPSADFYNLVIWQDVEGEVGASYSVYTSRKPIEDITATDVEKLASSIVEGTQSLAHSIYYPLVNHELTTYYAVTCTDAAGNESLPAKSTGFTNVAKGIPTIALNAPANFAIDGDFSEWQAAGIKPWVLKPEVNKVIGTVTDSTDLKATVYLAIDDDYLYVGVDVVDNVYNFGSGNWWDQDALELFIGLYNLTGSKHPRNMRGAQPDYKLQFHENGIVNEYINRTIWKKTDANYHLESFSGADYVIEAKIPLDSIAGPNDTRFHPQRGMRIPMEIYFHDNDGGWEGNLAWSPYNEDHAWEYPTQWAYSWIGDTMDVVETGIEKEKPQVAKIYKLEQNYPNPFNPTTMIHYAVAKPGIVKLSVFNMLGQKVAELVNENKNTGSYRVVWNAKEMPSGIYFYRLESGNYTDVKKMLLVK